jgi:hypothetical protein
MLADACSRTAHDEVVGPTIEVEPLRITDAGLGPTPYEWRGVKVTCLVYLQRIVADRGGPIGTHRKVAYTTGQNFLTLGGVSVARVHLGREQRRALEVLADAGLRGCTGATLLGHGFNIDMIADLVKDGLATAHRETMRMGRRKIQVARVRITDAGRRALEGPES